MVFPDKQSVILIDCILVLPIVYQFILVVICHCPPVPFVCPSPLFCQVMFIIYQSSSFIIFYHSPVCHFPLSLIWLFPIVYKFPLSSIPHCLSFPLYVFWYKPLSTNSHCLSIPIVCHYHCMLSTIFCHMPLSVIHHCLSSIGSVLCSHEYGTLLFQAVNYTRLLHSNHDGGDVLLFLIVSSWSVLA